MDHKHNCARGRIANVAAPLTRDAFEAKLNDSLVESLVPTATCLMHAIDAFHKLHDPCFLTWGLKARWLLHVCCLTLGQDAMEEHSFYIEVLDVPAKACSNVEKRMEQFQTGCGGSGFGKIDTRLLSKPLCNIAHLVSDNLTSIILFSLADKLALKKPSALRDQRARHKCKCLKVLEAP